MNRVKSPCIRHCCLNEADICTGCLRSLEEIKQWGVADNETKKEIIERIQALEKESQ